MTWSKQKSLVRIQGFLGSVPHSAIGVRTFTANDLQKRRSAIQANRAKSGRREDLIFNVRPSEAVIVDGVHVYVQLLDFATAMTEQGRETEAAHRRVLSMLHLHYSGCDRIAEQFEAQRVDYHGSRMHAVIVSPAGPLGAAERVGKALAFADALKRTIEAAGRTIAGGRYSTRVRIGMDSGTAVAVSSGRANEPEPLFLGDPANYAAKLADGVSEGIYLSDRIRAGLGLGPVGGLHQERTRDYQGLQATTPLSQMISDLRASDNDIARAVRGSVQSYETSLGTAPEFTFHHHTPPLRTIDFGELSPANSVRMDLMSIFADIDGFTEYVSRCIRTGRVAEMVSNLHVIRHELAATLKDDFDGRKVRFIGDCIHGLVAEGTRLETDLPGSVRTVVHAAAGMRSSFELCQTVLPNIGELGLAIGIELGTTPITRLGIRGDRSVRASISKAVSTSEGLQADCHGKQTALGERAMGTAPASTRRLFGADGKTENLNYAVIEWQSALQSVASPLLNRVQFETRSINLPGSPRGWRSELESTVFKLDAV
jgi:hypothetical protein